MYALSKCPQRPKISIRAIVLFCLCPRTIKWSKAAEREATVVLGEVVLTQQVEVGMEEGEEGGMEVVEEGDEPYEFWTSLGSLEKGTGGQVAPREPRMFQVSDAKGRMKVEEIVNFAQVD